jgi:hypothetical protein
VIHLLHEYARIRSRLKKLRLLAVYFELLQISGEVYSKEFGVKEEKWKRELILRMDGLNKKKSQSFQYNVFECYGSGAINWEPILNTCGEELSYELSVSRKGKRASSVL